MINGEVSSTLEVQCQLFWGVNIDILLTSKLHHIDCVLFYAVYNLVCVLTLWFVQTLKHSLVYTKSIKKIFFLQQEHLTWV